MTGDDDAGPSLSRRAMIAVPLSVAATAAAARSEPEALRIGGSGEADEFSEPLGIGLEGLPYPAPVSFLPLSWNGMPVRMAYMHFEALAKPNGRTAFLLHGKNFDSSYWSGPIAWLRSAGYRVIVPDQIGFNKSAKPAGTYHFEALAANTLALADSLSIPSFDLIGQSTGGMLATLIAGRHPDRVRRLVLEDPIGLIDYGKFIPPQTTETLVAAERAYTPASYRAFVAHFFPLLPASQYEPFVIWRMRVTRSAEFERFALASALTYQMIHGQPVLPWFPRLRMPVLMTAGTADRSVPLITYARPEARDRIPLIPEAARTVVRTIPDARLVEFPGVGHVPHLEAADRFREVVLDFLS